MYAKLLNRAVLVINSVDVARNLMEKRGAIYSDRPRFVLMNEMYVLPDPEYHIANVAKPRLGLDGNVAMLPYGERFRRSRRWIHDSFSTTALSTYHSRQRRETNVLLKGILARPTAFTSYIAR